MKKRLFQQPVNRIFVICGAVLISYGTAGLMNFGFAWFGGQAAAFHWMNAVLLAGILAVGVELLRLRSWARWCALGIFMFYFLSGCLYLGLRMWGSHGLPQLAKPWMTWLNIIIGGLGYFLLSRPKLGSHDSQWRFLGAALLISLGFFVLLGLGAVQKG